MTKNIIVTIFVFMVSIVFIGCHNPVMSLGSQTDNMINENENVTNIIEEVPINNYNVVIDVKPVIYTVSFLNQYGNTECQYIAHNELAIEPKPLNNFFINNYSYYRFIGWDYNFFDPILSDLVINAQWEYVELTIADYYFEYARINDSRNKFIINIIFYLNEVADFNVDDIILKNGFYNITSEYLVDISEYFIDGSGCYTGNTNVYELHIEADYISSYVTFYIKKDGYSFMSDNVSCIPEFCDETDCMCYANTQYNARFTIPENTYVVNLRDYDDPNMDYDYLESCDYEDIIDKVSIYVKTKNGLVKIPSGDLGESVILIPEFSSEPVRVFYNNNSSILRFRTSSSKGTNSSENEVELVMMVSY